MNRCAVLFAAILLVVQSMGFRDCDQSHKHNHIVKENCRQGNPSNEWDVNGAGDPTIQGFSTDISYNVGEVAKFKVNTTATSYRVDIYRLGYYGGLGARKLATVQPLTPPPHSQPKCFTDSSTMIYDCAEWSVTAEWKIPEGTVSGVFIARLVRTDGAPMRSWRADNSAFEDDPHHAMPGGASMQRPRPQPHAYGASGHGKLRNQLKEPQASLVYFVVRDDASHSDIVFQTSDTVWQAYNTEGGWEGGTSTYGSFIPERPRDRCYVSSLNRPLKTRGVRACNAYFGAEYPISRFLEANGYDVTYIAGVDTDRYGEKLLPRHKMFISAGHDEYWSGPQRANVEKARDNGLHLAFLSGNEMFWRIRWEDNYRKMVCYKDSQSLTKLDPKEGEWTGTWRDARAINPLGPQPENAVTGQVFTMNAWVNDPLVVPHQFSKHRQWRNTAVEALHPGQQAVLFKGIIGHEADEDIDNGFRPRNMIHLSETVVDNVMYVQDHGSVYDSGTGVHHLTLYRHNVSGALVFGAGTVQWGWALDGFHDSHRGFPAHLTNPANIRLFHDQTAPDRNIQQFTVNLLWDMGVQPDSLDDHLRHPLDEPHNNDPQCHFMSFKRVELDDGSHVADLEVHAMVPSGDGVIATVEVALSLSNHYDEPDQWGLRWFRANRYPEHDARGTHWKIRIPVIPEHLQAGAGRGILRAHCLATDDSLNTQKTPNTAHIVEHALPGAPEEEESVVEEVAPVDTPLEDGAPRYHYVTPEEAMRLDEEADAAARAEDGEQL